jgi:DAACS family dicarboxylate/amino acid:cation (Na+ or H+) symporter
MDTTKSGGFPLWLLMLIGFAIGLSIGIYVNQTIIAAHLANPEMAMVGQAAQVEWIIDNITGPIGQIFLGLLFMLMLPLLFSAIVVGVSEMGDLTALGRVGWKTLLMTVIVSSIAVLIGLAAVNILQPGAGIDQALAQRLLEQNASAAQGIVENAPENVNFGQFFLDLVPRNVVNAAAQTQVLPLMVFAVFFGIGLVMVKSKASDQLQLMITGLFEVMMKLLNLVIKTAPIAIACLMFNLAAMFGWELLLALGRFTGVAIGAMAIHMFVVYPLFVMILGGKSPFAFFGQIRDPMVVAFSTASSNATLPVSLRAAETELKLPSKISRFVLTVGATANQNGTALFEGVTVLFLAQFFGIALSIDQQIIVMLVCILGGIGTAGVPGGSLPVIAMILAMVGIPPEGIGLILGVDRILDMCRTTLNVTGDLVVAQIVSRGERDPVEAPRLEPEAPPAG